MQAVEVKRGATFEADLDFDDDDEWALAFPHEAVGAAVKFGHRRYVLTVTVDPANRRFKATADDTSNWPLTGDATAGFDYWVTKDGKQIAFPGSYNVPLKIIEGATR